MRSYLQRLHFPVRDFYALCVGFGSHNGLHLQTASGRRVSNAGDQDCQRPQRDGSPIDADEAEHSVLDWIPLRPTSGMVANSYFQARHIGKFLKFKLPQAGPTAVASPSVGQDQETWHIAKIPLTQCLPPRGNRIYREFRSVGRKADGDKSSILTQYVDPIRTCSPLRILKKIVTIHLFPVLRPGSSSVFEVANQFLFLRIDTDYGPTSLQESFLDSKNVAKLPITIRMWRSGKPFSIGLQGISQFHQQTTNCFLSQRIPPFCHQFTQSPQTQAHPLLLDHRIAACFLSQELRQRCFQRYTFFSTLGLPAPGRRMRSVSGFVTELFSSRRPFRIVRTLMPVINDNRRSPPWPIRLDSRATNKRRWRSSSCLTNAFIRRCSSLFGWSSDPLQSGHWHLRAASCIRTPPAGMGPFQLEQQKMASNFYPAP